MNKEKQIEEMSQDICSLFSTCEECQNVSPIIKTNCKAKKYAKRAIEAGYRRASDVAREIFEEIDTLLQLGRRYNMMQGDYYTFELRQSIAELKKKYTESEKEE